MNYTLHVQDCAYSSWKFNEEDAKMSTDEFHPLQHKWFHDDCISVPSMQCTHSSVRTAPYLCGVLLLEGNKTFGRSANKKRLLYRVIPASSHLPHFLVPYEIPTQFVKAHKNKYVLFTFSSWNEKHPIGTLINLLGDVDLREAYYEYQLYNKKLHHSIKELTQRVHEITKSPSLTANNIDATFSIMDRTHRTGIISIDPPHSTSFDDALDIECVGNEIHVTVYLANVFVHLETLQLWKSLSKRVASIYLPDRRLPMLPTQLAEEVCSLHAQRDRQALAIDFVYTKEGVLLHTSFHMAKVRVHRNYVYEEVGLLQDPTYTSLFSWTNTSHENMISSQHLVSHWMIAANNAAAQQLYKHHTGIFRTVTDTGIGPSQTIVPWLGYIGRGQYQLYDGLGHPTNLYTQTTSPIRRLVDLINQTMLCSTMNIKLSEDTLAFMKGWTENMKDLNISMSSIRKLQIDCTLLHKCAQQTNVFDGVHEGIVFDKNLKKGEGFSYMVYLKTYKLLSRFHTVIDIPNHSQCLFRMFLFETEHRTKQNIRLEYVSTNV